MLGMKMSKLDEPVLRDILEIYGDITGSKRVRDYLKPDANPGMKFVLQHAQERLAHTNAEEARFGSSICGDAKFFIWREDSFEDGDYLIRFAFDPNLVHGQEADAMTAAFEKAVDWYLLRQELAVFLRRNYKCHDFFEAFKRSIEEEYNRTANSWVACARSIIFRLETDLDYDRKLKLNPEQRKILMGWVERAKLKGFDLGEKYPDKAAIPSKENWEDIINDLAIVKLMMTR